jgi:putative membrane protein
MQTAADIHDEGRIPYRKAIIAVSIILPLAVAALFGIKIKGYDFTFLPPIYATINGFTAIFLTAAIVAIKRGKRRLHQVLINICIFLSVSFLVMYVLYHITSDTTVYGGEGPVRYVYYFILITHILLSVAIIPLVLFTYVRGWSGHFTKHRSLGKIAFPLWLYVAVTGVIVYLMISPYYS